MASARAAVLVTLLTALTGHIVIRLDLFQNTPFDVFIPPPTDRPVVVVWPKPSLSPMGKYVDAVVAADNLFCSEIGRNILIRGGNAIDAAIATTICIGVMDPHNAGIGLRPPQYHPRPKMTFASNNVLEFGKNNFLTNIKGYLPIQQRAIPLVESEKKCYVIDAKERAPMKSHKDMYEQDKNASRIGWKATAVPGEIHGLYTAYQNFASKKLPWADLLQPTIDLLTHGYPVSDNLARALAGFRDNIVNALTLHIFINNKTGEPYKTGEIMTRPILADTLRRLASAADPIAEFYHTGEVSQRLLADYKSNGALIDGTDLQQYESIIRKPEEVIYTNLGRATNLRICGPPPPSSSAIAHSILNVMFKFYPEPANFFRTFATEELVYHRFVETLKFVHAHRSLMGDMDFVPEALGAACNMSTDAYAEWIKKMITDSVHPQSYYMGNNAASVKENHGTTHISIVDSDGNAVSITTSINLYFGSKCRSESTGIIPNNAMLDFSTPGDVNYFGFPPSTTNFIFPGKKPMSSMCPNVIFDRTTGKVELVFGAAGGSRIMSATAYVAMRALLFNETIKEAVDAPRIHNQFLPNVTLYKEGFPDVFVEQLQSRGQLMKLLPVTATSVVTAIKRGEHGFWYANSDKIKGSASITAGF